MMETTEYSEIHRNELVVILCQNVPKYFSERDVADFQKYLDEKNWDGHDVFIDRDQSIIGCGSYYIQSPSVIGLAWTFFAPSRIGHRKLLPALEDYLAGIRFRSGTADSELTFSLNTTPQVSKLLSRLGFSTTETVKDGYGPGYDKVRMEKRHKK
jgi:hypothetical protein